MKNPLLCELTRILRATGFSCSGFAAAWQEKGAFRSECLAAALLAPLSFFLDITAAEHALLLLSLALVLIVELLNSALEAAIDLASPGWHELAKKVKDCASAAVLLSLMAAALVWGAVLI